MCISDSVAGVAKGHVTQSECLKELPPGHLFMVQDILYFRCKGVFMHKINQQTLELEGEVTQEEVSKTGKRLFFKECEPNTPLSDNDPTLRDLVGSYAFSDNRHLYLLVRDLPYKEEDKEIRQLVIEVYGLKDGQWTYIRHIPLRQQNKATLSESSPL